MKLQRVLVRKNKDGKPFYKWQVTLPPAVIEGLGWEAGEVLDAVVDRGRLIIRRQ